MRVVKVNAAPTLTELFDAPDVMLGGASFEVFEVRARRIKADLPLRDRLLANYVASRKEFGPPEVVEQRVHIGLPAGPDEHRMSSFHEVAWPDAAKLIAEMDHDGLRTFAARVIYCEARAHLPEEVRRTVEWEMTDRLVVETSYGFTIKQAIDCIDEIRVSTDDPIGILPGYRTYLVKRQQKVLAYRTTLQTR